jgi:outer membrane protein, heavy metal efflux system
MLGSTMWWRSAFAASALSFLLSGWAEANDRIDEESTGSAIPPLSVVIALAREHAPEVLVGEAQVTTARSSLVGARLPPIGNPYLELVTKGRPGESAQSLDVDGQLWLPLEVAGQRGARVDEARALVDFQRKALGYSRALAIAQALRAYGVVTVGAERIRLFESLLDVSRSEAKSYEARYSAGDVTLRDERLSKLELGRYGVLLEEAKADVFLGLFELNRLTGAAYSRLPSTLARPPFSFTLDRRGLDEAPALQVSKAEAAYYGRARERLHLEGVTGALSLILNAGRDELGAVRVGAGAGYAFPVVRRNQGEQARAEAERSRALLDERLARRILKVRIQSLRKELEQVRRALHVLNEEAEPAAVGAVEAATEMQKAGKSDLLPALTSRRDLGLLRLRRLDLVAREWNIASSLVAITGRIS